MHMHFAPSSLLTSSLFSVLLSQPLPSSSGWWGAGGETSFILHTQEERQRKVLVVITVIVVVFPHPEVHTRREEEEVVGEHARAKRKEWCASRETERGQRHTATHLPPTCTQAFYEHVERRNAKRTPSHLRLLTQAHTPIDSLGRRGGRLGRPHSRKRPTILPSYSLKRYFFFRN